MCMCSKGIVRFILIALKLQLLDWKTLRGVIFSILRRVNPAFKTLFTIYGLTIFQVYVHRFT